MFKVTELVKARNDRSLGRFHYHWRKVHSDLVRPFSEINSYYQNHEIDPCVWGFKPCNFHGILEVWFDDAISADQLFSGDYFRSIVKPDEYNFANLGEVIFYAVKDRVVTCQRPFAYHDRQVKAVLLLNRQDDQPLEDFVTTLENDVVPRILEVCPLIVRAVISMTIEDSAFTRRSPPDVQLALWFDKIADYDLSAPQYSMVAALLEAVIEPGSATSFLLEPLKMTIASDNLGEY